MTTISDRTTDTRSGSALPPVPRTLARQESRATAALIGLGLLLLVGTTLLIPSIAAEEALRARRIAVWHKGQATRGIVSDSTRGAFGRKRIRYQYGASGRSFEGERVVAHVKDFEELVVGRALDVRFDPQAPDFSVIALDVAEDLEDQVPGHLLVLIVVCVGGLLAWMGYRRRRLLRYGDQVPCALSPSFSPVFVRASYVWREVRYSRIVASLSQRDGNLGWLLLDPRWPAWPVLAASDSFDSGGEAPRWSLQDFRTGWRAALVPATLAAWVAWGALSLVTGEALPTGIRELMCVVVAGAVLFISKHPSRQ